MHVVGTDGRMSVDYRSPRALIESGPVTIPELFEWNARENPEYPLFRFPDGHGALKTITYAEAIGAIRRVARHIVALVGSTERCAVALLANAGMVCFTAIFHRRGTNVRSLLQIP